MPELPEVETVCNGLRPALVGNVFERVIVRRDGLRFPFPTGFAGRLTGQKVTAVRRRSKYILVELDDGHVLIIHLGMSGSIRIITSGDAQRPGDFYHERSKSAAHDHVSFIMGGGEQIIYNDPRRFGLMDILRREDLAAHKLFKNIGIEPFDEKLTGDFLSKHFQNKAAALKLALLDQGLIAGIGNIYACEILHQMGLSPFRAAKSLAGAGDAETRDLLVRTIRDVLARAIAAGGSTLRDHKQTDGELGYFQHNFRVYDREDAPCPTPGCHGVILRAVQGGRSTFYCAECQK